MLIVRTILLRFRSPMRSVILLIVWLPTSFTICVVVVNLESIYQQCIIQYYKWPCQKLKLWHNHLEFVHYKTATLKYIKKYAKGMNYKMAIYQACILLFQSCMCGLRGWLHFFNILPRGLRTYYMSLWITNTIKIFSRIPVFLLFLFFSPPPLH